jgi:uncharacterized protein (DUF3820 family)
MVHFDDKSLMPFGKYQGHKLANVPPDYLLFLLDQPWLHEGALKEYIKKNKSTLEQEVNLNKKLNNR